MRGLIPECQEEFKAIMDKEVGEEEKNYECNLRLIDGEYLTNEEGGECGGIVLINTNRKIVCYNTLKSRLDLCFEELLPHIRKLLFPKRKWNAYQKGRL